MKRFVILDRDGTLIVDRGYLGDPVRVELLPNAAAGLRAMQALGLVLIVATNQSGVARRLFDKAAVDAVNSRMRTLLESEGVTLDDVFVCPHGPDDDCGCRKPKPGLVLAAAERWGFNPAECFVIGDQACDIGLGKAVGAATILVAGSSIDGQRERKADYIVPDLVGAASVIAMTLDVNMRATLCIP